MPHIPASYLLVGSVIAAFVGITSFIAAPTSTTMRLSPNTGLIVKGEVLHVDVHVDATEPVNVFSGEVRFDPTILEVASIDYNTSIADLWAELPWYSNGEGTLNFAGGSTMPGGFIGSGSLIQITFRAKDPGAAELRLEDARILRHDGLGTDVTLADTPIDALFTISPEALEEITIAKANPAPERAVRVVTKRPEPDLNNDGIQNFTDVSIFMAHLAQQNKRSDFDQNGIVGLSDLSILMELHRK